MTGDERRAGLIDADAHRNHLEEHRDCAADRLEHDRRRDCRRLGPDQQQRDIDFGDGQDLVGRLARGNRGQMARTNRGPS